MNQKAIWSDPKIRAARLPAAEQYLGRTMEMEGHGMTNEELASEIRASREVRAIRLRDGWVNPSPLTVLAEVADRLDEAVFLLDQARGYLPDAGTRTHVDAFLAKART